MSDKPNDLLKEPNALLSDSSSTGKLLRRSSTVSRFKKKVNTSMHTDEKHIRGSATDLALNDEAHLPPPIATTKDERAEKLGRRQRTFWTNDKRRKQELRVCGALLVKINVSELWLLRLTLAWQCYMQMLPITLIKLVSSKRTPNKFSKSSVRLAWTKLKRSSVGVCDLGHISTFYIWNETDRQCIEKTDRPTSWNSKELTSLQKTLFLLRKMFLYVPELMRNGWQRQSIGTS